MKTLLIVSVIILFSIMNTYGQNNELILKKEKNNKEKIIREGKKIKVITFNDQKIAGSFEICGDSVLIIKKDSLLLSEIKIIRTISLASKISGGTLAGVGGIFTLGGALLTIKGFADGGLAVIGAVFLGIPITTVGIIVITTGILMATTGKKHKSKNWDYSVAGK